MRNPLITLYVKAQVAFANRQHALRNRDDRGAGFVEYAAVIVLVAAIAAAVFTTNIGSTIATSLTTKISQILGGGGGTPAVPAATPL